VALLLLTLFIPGVRASLSSWLGLSVAPADQVPVTAVTLEAINPAPSGGTTPTAAQQPMLPTTSTTTPQSSAPTAEQPVIPADNQLNFSQLSSQIGWDILTPSFIPEGYHYQSAYFDPNQKMLVLTYLVTRPLPNSTDPSLTSSETITLLQSQRNDFIPMQVAPSTVISDTLVNGAPAAYTIGGWDTEFVKDNQSPGGGKMVSSWRNDLPVKNLYWQVGKLYLTLITADEAVSQQELLDMASSTGK
jgi:hypothetical protein